MQRLRDPQSIGVRVAIEVVRRDLDLGQVEVGEEGRWGELRQRDVADDEVLLPRGRPPTGLKAPVERRDDVGHQRSRRIPHDRLRLPVVEGERPADEALEFPLSGGHVEDLLELTEHGAVGCGTTRLEIPAGVEGRDLLRQPVQQAVRGLHLQDVEVVDGQAPRAQRRREQRLERLIGEAVAPEVTEDDHRPRTVAALAAGPSTTLQERRLVARCLVLDDGADLGVVEAHLQAARRDDDVGVGVDPRALAARAGDLSRPAGVRSRPICGGTHHVWPSRSRSSASAAGCCARSRSAARGRRSASRRSQSRRLCTSSVSVNAKRRLPLVPVGSGADLDSSIRARAKVAWMVVDRRAVPDIGLPRRTSVYSAPSDTMSSRLGVTCRGSSMPVSDAMNSSGDSSVADRPTTCRSTPAPEERSPAPQQQRHLRTVGRRRTCGPRRAGGSAGGRPVTPSITDRRSLLARHRLSISVLVKSRSGGS